MIKLPRISIITPSYNQGKFIENTIQSVLSQNYPDLEYLIMDGGSTDGTLKILKKYGKGIKLFSKKDKGQSNALNEGIKKTSGAIIGYLNSDDYLTPDALKKVGEYFQKHPQTFWLTGKCFIVDEEGKEIRRSATLYKNFFLKFLRSFSVFSVIQFISQPATFWRRAVADKIGEFDETLFYDMDYDYWLRIWSKWKLHFINEYLACYRIQPSSKAVLSPEKQFLIEHEIAKRHIRSPIFLALHKLHTMLALKVYRTVWIK